MTTKRKAFKKIVIASGMAGWLLFTGSVTQNNYLNIIEAQAAESTFSEYWYQDQAGSWHVRDGNGDMITNAWLCDDAVASNGQNIWYLIDSNGNMISAGLVQDQTGNYYSLETNHNGYYGMLRYQSGSYDSISLDLEKGHGGSFAAIKNTDGIEALKAKYGVTIVNIDNSNCVYTSAFKSTSSTKSSSSNSSTNASSSIPYSNHSNGKVTDGEMQKILNKIATNKLGLLSLTEEEMEAYNLYRFGSETGSFNGKIGGSTGAQIQLY